MAFIKSALIFLALVVLFVTIDARPSPFADATISGTLLSNFVGGPVMPSYTNYAAYNPYAGYGYFG
jgi:hypothetical protein